MSNEIQFDGVTATTCYVNLWNSVGQVYNTSTQAFEAYLTANYANYKIAGVEQGTASGMFLASVPSTGVPAGYYKVYAYQQAGGSPVEADLRIAAGDIYWSGTLTTFFNTDANGRISVQSGVTRNQGISEFGFFMVSSSDHVSGATGLTVTAQRSIDGGAFQSCINSVAEVGGGNYVINLASSDLNGGVIVLRFSATGADTTDITIVTTP